jgi:hypothetical protein
MDDDVRLEFFRLKVRTQILEGLLLRLAFSSIAQSVPRRSNQEARQIIADYLQTAETAAIEAYGAHFRDPALAALYADEVSEIVQSLVDLV